MGWPDLTYRSRLEPRLRNELEQLVALLIGWLSKEHGPTGEHTTITVDAIRFREAAGTTGLGAWIDVPFNAANVTGSGGMTVTTTAADQVTYAYTLIGRTLVLTWYFQTVSVGGALSNAIRLAIPGGFSATRIVTAPITLIDNGTPVDAFAQVDGGGTTIILVKRDVSLFAASVDATSFHGQLSIPI